MRDGSDNNDGKGKDGTGTGIVTKTRPKVKKPSLYKVLLLNDPTRGIDHRAKRDIYTLLGALATNRVAVVMLSSEVDELVELMDRVLVFWENSLVETIPRANLTRANLVSSFFGEPASA